MEVGVDDVDDFVGGASVRHRRVAAHVAEDDRQVPGAPAGLAQGLVVGEAVDDRFVDVMQEELGSMHHRVEVTRELPELVTPVFGHSL